tara:strand:+ start:10190 stop:10993 length:804 start_codon:yes stop_codon:yes gene_type:complete
MSSEVTIDLKDEKSRAGALVILCFPGPGFVANIVGQHLIESLDLKSIGSIRHPKLPPACIVKHGLSLPTIRIYSGEPICNHEICDRVLLVVSETQVPNNIILSLSEGIVGWAASEKAGAMLVLDSYSSAIESGHAIDDTDGSNETVKGAASTTNALQSLNDMKIERMENGAIGGLTGVMLAECSRIGFDATAILAECSGPMQGMGPDARTAARVLTRLDFLLPAIKLDPAPLLEEARKIESQINEMMASSVNQEQTPLNKGSTSMFG